MIRNLISLLYLGTGLHTFVLYLGPFIASATLAATECNSTNFERYGPSRFICPADADKSAAAPQFTDIFKIVALEAFLWGAGTAIGELPPYFVARAARLAGQRVAELDEGAEEIKQDTSFIGKVKQFALNRLGNLGFVGIMLFASIPNPLFDLAGLTCGRILLQFQSRSLYIRIRCFP
jgi:vacuole membrane protein 1